MKLHSAIFYHAAFTALTATAAALLLLTVSCSTPLMQKEGAVNISQHLAAPAAPRPQFATPTTATPATNVAGSARQMIHEETTDRARTFPIYIVQHGATLTITGDHSPASSRGADSETPTAQVSRLKWLGIGIGSTVALGVLLYLFHDLIFKTLKAAAIAAKLGALIP